MTSKKLKVETWKIIPDFPCYEISNTGFVRVLISQKKGISIPGMILKFRLGGAKKQYHRVALVKDGRQYDRYVHRLVCSIYNGTPPRKEYQVAHLDGNPKNNNAENLIWATVKENHSHKTLHGTHLIGDKNPMAKIKEEIALSILEDYISGQKSALIADKYNTTISTVLSIASGRGWSHVGTKEQRKKAKIVCKQNMNTLQKKLNQGQSYAV